MAHLRLYHQRLVGPACRKVEEVVGGLLAVQAQDYPGARWAIAQRMQDGSDADVEAAFADGRLVRTHVLRPTWHLVLAEDLRWLLELTAPRVHAANAYYYKKLDLDEATLRRAGARLARALEGGRELTRDELAAALAESGIEADGPRLAYVVMHAELEGLVCSGRMLGKQHTYALVEERVPPAKKRRRDEALVELARRYLRGHGPAQAADLAWWSGLTVADVKKAFDLLGSEVSEETLGDKVYYRAALAAAPPRRTTTVHLLPNYDELVVGFKDHAVTLDDALAGRERDELEPVLGTHLVVRNGRVIGGWRRTLGKTDDVAIEATVLVPLADEERRLLAAAAERYGAALGLAATLTVEVRA